MSRCRVDALSATRHPVIEYDSRVCVCVCMYLWVGFLSVLNVRDMCSGGWRSGIDYGRVAQAMRSLARSVRSDRIRVL